MTSVIKRQPLKLSSCQKFGTLLLIDNKPPKFSEEDRQLFTDLAAMIEEVIAALELTTQDELKGIANRRGFMNLAQYALGFCQRHYHRSATLLMIDLDYFRAVGGSFTLWYNLIRFVTPVAVAIVFVYNLIA